MAKFILTHPAKPAEFDMTDVETHGPTKSKAGKSHPDHPDLAMTPKAIRQRSRRRQTITAKEFNELYKPVEEWDAEELRRGRPRAADGSFRGAAPKWLDREVHEKIVDRYRKIVSDRMREESLAAVDVVALIMNDNEVDDKGKPRTPASTKLQAAQWLVEHLVGKPKQRTETDISVKLQGVLAHAMVGGAGEGVFGGGLPSPALPPLGQAVAEDLVDAEAWEDDDD